MLRVIAAIIVVAATITAAVECAQTPAPRALPRWLWLIVIVVAPVLGPAAWFVVGRTLGRRAGSVVGAPDDDPRFLRKLSDDAWSRKQRERRGETPPDPSTPTDSNPA